MSPSSARGRGGSLMLATRLKLLGGNKLRSRAAFVALHGLCLGLASLSIAVVTATFVDMHGVGRRIAALCCLLIDLP